MRSMFALRHTAQSLTTSKNDKQYACGWWGNKTPTSHLASGPEAKERRGEHMFGQKIFSINLELNLQYRVRTVILEL